MSFLAGKGLCQLGPKQVKRPRLDILTIEADQHVVPLLEAERACTFVGAEAEQRLRGDDASPAGLTSRDSLELSQFLERIDADVRVGADADADGPRADALDG